MDKGKKGFSLLIGLGGGKPKPGDRGGMGMGGDDEAATMAFSALRKALKDDDAEAGVAAFKELLACCDSEEDAAEDDEEPTGKPDDSEVW